MPLQFKLSGLSLILTAIVGAADVSADVVYRWKDGGGGWMYGSRPPAGAKAEAVEGRSLSRYSSDKVIKAFQPPTVSPPPISDEARASLENDPVRESDLVKGLAKLEYENIIFSANGKKSEITDCKVRVKNTGGEPAKDVLVSFRFPDGSVVPAGGPERLNAGEQAEYAVLPTQLPIKLKAVEKGPANRPVDPPTVELRFISDGSVPATAEAADPIGE